MEERDRKKSGATVLLFSIVYMVSYMTRINFGAVISEMVQATQIARPLLSLSVTGSFAAYGLGQIVSGIFGDRLQPKGLIAGGLGLTALMNGLIPFCSDHISMLLCWCINGFAQAFMWPPLVRMMSALPTQEDYSRATVLVNRGGSLGTVAVYLIAPAAILLSGWQSVFWICAAAATVMLLVWLRFARPVQVQKPERGGSVGKVLFSPVMLLIMLSISLMGMLRDGVTTWMPSYIADRYGLGNAGAILSGAVLPVVSIFAYQGASVLHGKKLKNPVTCAGVLFGVGAGSALALWLSSGLSPVLGVIFSALLTGCMHGVNLMLVCILPSYFKRWGSTAFASGVLNACTYAGSAVATYGFAALSQSAGWSATVLLWVLAAALGGGICALCAKGFSKRFAD